MTKTQLMDGIRYSYGAEKVQENLVFEVRDDNKIERLHSKHVVGMVDNKIWIYKDSNFYRDTAEIINMTSILIRLLQMDEVFLITVPFCVNISESNRHLIFPDYSKRIDSMVQKSTVGKYQPQDFCLLGIKEFYNDIMRYNKDTILEIQNSVYDNNKFFYDPLYISNDVHDLFLKASAGVTDVEDYNINKKWNVLKLTEHCCKYVEQKGTQLNNGILSANTLYEYMFSKAGKHYSPEFIKQLSQQIYYENARK